MGFMLSASPFGQKMPRRRGASLLFDDTSVTGPVSRVLSWTTIYLGCGSPHSSSHLGENDGPPPGRSPNPAVVLLQVGFTWPPGLPDAGELLPRLSILTGKIRRFLSVALSLESPPAAVSSYLALRSPDFPRAGPFGAPPAAVRPGHIGSPTVYHPRLLSASGARPPSFPLFVL